MSNEFSEKLKNSRLEMNKSQKEFAALLGVSKRSISMYENGNRVPPLKTILKMQNLLEIDLINTNLKGEQNEMD